MNSLRPWIVAALTLLLGCEASPETEAGPSPPVVVAAVPEAPCPPSAAATGFVRREGGRLLDEHGMPVRALGTNLYYLQQLFTYGELGNKEPPLLARQALDLAVCLGMPMVRTNGFNDAQDETAIRTKPGEALEAGLRGLDMAVAEAKARGLRVILTFTNNWKDYGGLPAYAAWTGKTHDDFFGDAQMMELWKQHASTVVARINTVTNVAYKDEPAILAWEIGNELRCPSCKGTRYVDTIRALAQHLKSIDPNHLVSDGGEGFDDAEAPYRGLSNLYAVSGDEGTSYSKLALVPELDLLSSHFYPTSWGLNTAGDARIWIDAHAAIATKADKVAFLSEFGAEHAKTAGPAARDDARAHVYNDWLARAFAHNNAALVAQWQVIPASRRPSADDGFGVVPEQDTLTAGVLRHWATR